jgi:hypothetical protein
MVIAQSFHEVTPLVWTWHAYDPDVRTDLFSTAVRADAGLVLIDPIRLCDTGVEGLARHKPVAAIVLTNENHTRAAAWYRSRFAAPIFTHPDSIGAQTVTVDGTLNVNRMVAGNLRILEIAGAVPGEIALLHPGGSLHFGDAVVNLDSTGLAPLPDKYCTNPALLRESLRSLPISGVETVTFAHGPALTEEAVSRLLSFFKEPPSES